MRQIGLVLAPPEDIHAFAVQKAAERRGFGVVVLDTSTFLSDFHLSAHLGVDRGFEIARSSSSDVIHSGEISGIWWRRPLPPEPEKAHIHPATVDAIKAESAHALFGTLSAVTENNFNHIAQSRFASQKPVQLALAERYGFRVPRTLITSEPAKADAFLNSVRGGVIHKLFRGTDLGFFETRLITEEDRDQLWRLHKCPVLFQEYIAGKFDVRATIVGENVYSARIDYEHESEIVDSRFTTKKVSPIELPKDLQVSLIAFVKRLGLRYGAVDIRCDEDDKWIFFEINPEGQYLWTEIEAGLPISDQIVNELMRSV